MNSWGTVTWDVARAGGFTAYVLITLSVILGLALTLHWQKPRWPRLINNELHNFLTLLGLIFTGIHVLAIWLDPFTNFGWNEVFLPMVSHYRPLWMAFGIVALYLGLAIGLSTWLRPFIGYSWWRKLHVLTLVAFLLVTIHGIATGSDTRTWWGVFIYAGSILSVGTLLWMRLIKPANAQSRAHPFFAGLTVFIALIGSLLTVLGPLQPGWNAIANNGNGSGGTINAPASQNSPSSSAPRSSSQSSSIFTPPFTSNIQGTMTQTSPDSTGTITIRFDMTLTQPSGGTLQILLQGQTQSNGDDNNGGFAITSSRVSLGTTTTTDQYVGPLTNLYGDRDWHITAQLTGSGTASNTSLQVQIVLRIQNSGQVTGRISGSA